MKKIETIKLDKAKERHIYGKGTKLEKPKKGKGSYTRKSKHTKDHCTSQ